MANVISTDSKEPSSSEDGRGERLPGRMNLPNQLTVARLFLTLFFVAALSSTWKWGHTAGLLLFVAAGITDYLDGEIARQRNLITDFGKLMDPLADKIMMASAFICLIPYHAFPSWVAVVIISREFLITGLRLLAASNAVVLPAEKLGKHKTVWQIVTVIYFLLLLSSSEVARYTSTPLGTWWQTAWIFGGGALIVITLALTVYSGIGYAWRNRALISPS
jgi:CDP-diacylglycerol--glycerol-3-phosphate 3-phosphatidyltransferase